MFSELRKLLVVEAGFLAALETVPIRTVDCGDPAHSQKYNA
ncbi:MAG: hypothetical protein Kow00107_08910 [Planctomycetota bacterium]